MSEDKIEVNMNVYDIPILVEALEEANKEIERLNKRIEDLNIINEEHQILNGMIRKELQQKEAIIKEVREYINSIDEIEVRYLDKEALYRNNITEYQIQEQLKKDKTLEGHFVKANKYYLLEILDKGKE